MARDAVALCLSDPNSLWGGAAQRDYFLIQGLRDALGVGLALHHGERLPGRLPPTYARIPSESLRRRFSLGTFARVTSLRVPAIAFRYDFGHRNVADVASRSDVVHCSMMYPIATVSRRAFRRGDQLVVWDTHNFDPDVWFQRFVEHADSWVRKGFGRTQVFATRAAARTAIRRASVVLACTEDDAASWIRVGASRDRVHVVPNGFDATAWRGVRWAPESRELVLFGSLSQEVTLRGIEWFLGSSWPQVRSQGFTLVIAGREPPDWLRRMVSGDAGISLVANPESVAQVVSGSAGIVVPQVIGTGSKIKMYESIASGLPVVASPRALVGLSRDLRSVVTVAEGSEEWSGAVPAAIANHKPREASDVASGWSWQARGRQYAALLAHLMGERSV
jgi:glycosyltransferase involved in cell wall biosynthesis